MIASDQFSEARLQEPLQSHQTINDLVNQYPLVSSILPTVTGTTSPEQLEHLLAHLQARLKDLQGFSDSCFMNVPPLASNVSPSDMYKKSFESIRRKTGIACLAMDEQLEQVLMSATDPMVGLLFAMVQCHNSQEHSRNDEAFQLAIQVTEQQGPTIDENQGKNDFTRAWLQYADSHRPKETAHIASQQAMAARQVTNKEGRKKQLLERLP